MKYIIFIWLLLIGQHLYPQTVKLSITVNHLKVTNGVVFISLYNEEKSFPIDGKEFRKVAVKPLSLSVSYTYDNLQPGEYAVAIFHDQNGDGICNLGLLGIPKEGFGFSRNFKPKLKAPEFDDCSLVVNKDMTLVIDLIFR